MIHTGLLDNKVALVTGASRGIGRAIVKRFVEEGATVYASARTEEALYQLLKEEGNSNAGTITPLCFDVTDCAAAKKAVMQIKKDWGHIDILVNNAGIMKDSVIGMISPELLQDVFNTNVFAVINMIQLVNKLMSRQKSGSIINVSSIVGLEGAAGQVVYSASKGAVASLTKSAAKELIKNGVRVNAVAPGLIDTGLLQSIGEARINENMKNIKMGRLGDPIEVANAVLFLASDLSSYVTGEIIGVDGGAQV